jgi:hypothetical protein
MRWVFDNITKIITLLSFLVLVASTVHDWAYFYVVGDKFRSMQTTYDYVTNAIEWLPSFAFVTLMAGILGVAFGAFTTRDRSQFGFGDQAALYYEARNVQVYAILFGLSLFSFIGFWLGSLPFSLSFLALSVSSLFLGGLGFFLRGRTPAVAFKIWTLSAVSIGLTAGAFSFGIRDGAVAIDGPANVYKISLKGSGAQEVSLLRSFDKGVLVWSPVSKTAEFLRWEQI